MTLRLAVLLCLAAIMSAQVGPIPGPILPPGPVPPGPAQFPAALRLFLELTDAQVQAILNANTEYQRENAVRVRRVNQIQFEIAQELQKDQPNALAIGQGYVEIESIRRFLQGEQGRLRDRIRATLTEQQRARLRALEEIAKLLPIYNEAVAVNLLPPLDGARPVGVIRVTQPRSDGEGQSQP